MALSTRSKVLIGVFGVILAIIVIVCLCVLLPKDTKRSLGVWPRPEQEDGDGTFLALTQKQNYIYWANRTDKFLEPYKVPKHLERVYNCDYNRKPPQDNFCYIDIKGFGLCNKENYYDYHRNSPCLFLKLININEPWEPEAFKIESLPKDMPADLKNYIHDSTKSQSDYAKSVWISCEGSSPVDKENIGSIEYFPARQFPGYFFSAAGTPGYLDPLVAIHFKRPKGGAAIFVECKAWAPNIREDRSEEFISVTFTVMVQ